MIMWLARARARARSLSSSLSLLLSLSPPLSPSAGLYGMIMWLKQEWEAAEEEEEEDNIGAPSQKRPIKETYQKRREEEEDNVGAPHNHNLDKNQPALLPESKSNTSPIRRHVKRDLSVSKETHTYMHARMSWLGSRVPIHTCM